jgi:hypothetical protein
VVTAPAGAADIRVMVPRVRRAMEGIGMPAVLSDDAVKDATADAIAEVILYTGGVFGHDLLVIEIDQGGVPTEYATSEALSLPEQAVIASQAALNFFFGRFVGLKVSERIADEAQTWEYALSPQLLAAQLKALIAERDRALDMIAAQGVPLDEYVSFLAVRDSWTSAIVEPWVAGQLPSGQEFIDPRFGTVG